MRLAPKVSDLLLCLVEHRGRVVSKDELLEVVWDGRFLADSALSRTVAELRAALEDDARAPRFIETIPKTGYRLLPESESAPTVESEPVRSFVPLSSFGETAGARSEPPPRSTGTRRATLAAATIATSLVVVMTVLALRPREGPTEPRIPLVAVLPLTDLSPEAEPYFARGMTETLVARLAESGAVSVVSRHSVERLVAHSGPVLERAAEVGIDALVEGSVLRSEDDLRITVHLTEVGATEYSWVDTYERRMSDVLALQDDVARAISREVRATLDPRPPESWEYASRPVVPAAFELCLRAGSREGEPNRASLQEAFELYRQATVTDPAYAPAWAGLADMLVRSAQYGKAVIEDPWTEAEEALDRALALDPDLARAHAVRGTLRLIHEWDLAGAEASFQRALESNPSDTEVRFAYASYLTFRGRLDEAVAEARRAERLDPLGPSSVDAVAHALLHAGRYEELDDYLASKAPLIDDPRPNLYGLWSLALRGRWDEALDGGLHDVPEDKSSPVRIASLGWTLGQAGRTAEVAEARERLEALDAAKGVDPFFFAILEAGAGETDRAFAHLERAFEIRSPQLCYVAVEPFFGPIRDDPRLEEMVARLGV